MRIKRYISAMQNTLTLFGYTTNGNNGISISGVRYLLALTKTEGRHFFGALL